MSKIILKELMENTIHFFHRPLFLYLKVTEKAHKPKGDDDTTSEAHTMNISIAMGVVRYDTKQKQSATQLACQYFGYNIMQD
uniref:Uncharacterized protein n=1 Tax=Anguilla anguilla TaxID=7936 RepID=A0A0E9SJ71_ANGAN